MRGAVADGHVTAERHRADRRSVGQAGQQPGREVRRGGRRERRAGDHRRHERSGGHGPAELLDHHRQLGQAEPRAAVLLGDVQPEPAQPAQFGPEGGQLLGLRVEQRPGRLPGAAGAQEVGHGLGERSVIIGDGDRHE